MYPKFCLNNDKWLEKKGGSNGKKVVITTEAPAAIGPYSQGVVAEGKTIYISGKLPINPKTGEFAGNDIMSQTEQSLKNIQAILAAEGLKRC